MKCRRFLEVILFGVFFGQVWGNLGKHFSHSQKFACSYTCDSKRRYIKRFLRCWKGPHRCWKSSEQRNNRICPQCLVF